MLGERVLVQVILGKLLWKQFREQTGDSALQAGLIWRLLQYCSQDNIL